jgi:hypothetical protein
VNTFLWGLVLSSALIWASNESPYFPIKIKPGDDGISKFEAEWYGKSLERMKEPRLPGFIKDVNAEVYRVMILPTWGNPIVVRVRKRAEIYSLSARRLDGQGGYDPGKLVETTDVDLNADDSKALDALIQKLDFFNLATDDGGMGKDGDESIIEGVSSGRYHVVQRWCATSYDTEKRRLGAFVALVRFLLDKSNLSTRPSNKGHRLI